jgi:hypothetical protein
MTLAPAPDRSRAMKTKWSRLGLFCSFVVFGCSSGDTQQLADGEAQGTLCAELTQLASTFVAAHQSCNVDSDCTGEPAYGFSYDRGSQVSCWPPLVIATDSVSRFLALMDQMFAAKCNGPSVCYALFPEASCHQNVCTAS